MLDEEKTVVNITLRLNFFKGGKVKKGSLSKSCTHNLLIGNKLFVQLTWNIQAELQVQTSSRLWNYGKENFDSMSLPYMGTRGIQWTWRAKLMPLQINAYTSHLHVKTSFEEPGRTALELNAKEWKIDAEILKFCYFSKCLLCKFTKAGVVVQLQYVLWKISRIMPV